MRLRTRRLSRQRRWTGLRYLRVGLAFTFALILSSGFAAGQDLEALLGAPAEPGAESVESVKSEPPASTGDTPTATDQTVAVDRQQSDAAIAERLRNILKTTNRRTQRYEDPTVEVEDGLVFISGGARRESDKEWATALARRTDGVVGVHNDMSVSPEPAIEADDMWAEVRSLWRSFLATLPLFLLGLLVFTVLLLGARFLSRLATRPLKHLTHSVLLQNVARTVTAILIVLTGLYLLLRITGLEQIALTVVSGTGILGLIIGFAFRDIAENFLASVLLSVQTPFHIGDVVTVNDHTGVVQKVTARGTVLMDFDGNHIQIANSTVYKSTIKNLSANPNLRLSFGVGVGYDTGVAVAQQTIRRVLLDHEAVLQDPEPLVLADQLGAATVNLKVYFWINSREHSALKVRSAILRLVLRALVDAGVSLPDEAREIIFPQGVPVVSQAVAGPSGGSQAPPEAAVPAPPTPAEPAVSAAEGALASEVDEIRNQAAQSRDPESGSDVLGPATR